MKKTVLGIFACCMVLLTALSCFSVPDLELSKITCVDQTLTVFDCNGEACAVLHAGENRSSVSFDQIPAHVINALVATEDIRFFEHHGIDVYRIFGALWADIRSGSAKQGASTITQQLIKNSHLTSEKTFDRKIREAVLSMQLERQCSKEEILEMYFNYVYFGRGAYGIQAAAQSYFGVDASALDVVQGAMLVGVLKAPGRYAPHLHPDEALLRRNTVLAQMKKYGYLSQEEYDAYSALPVRIIEKEAPRDFGYYTDYVLEESASLLNITVDDLLGGGYRIYTTLDASLQTALQELYAQDDRFPDKNVQSACLVLDNQTGGIRAMVGGRTHEGMRLFNRCTARRQPGSCIKPILVYAPAFENGTVTPATMLEDTRMDFNGYAPTNFKNVYYGKVSVRRALSLSLNVPAVALLLQNGIEESKAVAQKAGIVFDPSDIYPAIALGGMKYGVTMTELAGAYRALAWDGRYCRPRCVERICDAEGKELYRHKSAFLQAFSPQTAYLLTDILTDVSHSNALKNAGFPVACKTGTVGYAGTPGYSDAWCMAYTRNVTVGVWMGYDETTPEQYLPPSVTGSSYPAELAAAVFACASADTDMGKFVCPQGVEKKKIDRLLLEKDLICPADASSAEVIEEYFDVSRTSFTSLSVLLPEPAFTVQTDEVGNAELLLEPYTEEAFLSVCRVRNGEQTPIFLITADGKEHCLTDEEYQSGDGYFCEAYVRKFDRDWYSPPGEVRYLS